jgi:protein phosphatase
MMSTLAFGATTHTGRVRNNNEDSYIALPESGLWVVADGMGGQQSGEVASAIAVHTIREAIQNRCSLTEAIEQAHRAIRSAADNDSFGMGTTVVALLSNDEQYEIAWVGDSRAYLWDLHTLQRLTRDHSMVQELVDAGVITEEAAAQHPKRNIITQSVGIAMESGPRVATVSGRWAPGQSILLCSDGLSGELDDGEICAILAATISPKDGAQQLLLAALEHGGSDNITVVLVSGPGEPTNVSAGLFQRLKSHLLG